MGTVLPQEFVADHPIEGLSEHPENPRRGDERALEESIDALGFYGAVVVQRSTGRVLAGNHRLRDMRKRGETTVPALLLDVDDDRARRILLADNRASDLGTYDHHQLRELLSSFDGDLTGTLYTDEELARLMAEIQPAPPDSFPAVDDKATTDHRCPSCGYEWNGKAVQ